jgi:MscS family membrane protein
MAIGLRSWAVVFIIAFGLVGPVGAQSSSSAPNASAAAEEEVMPGPLEPADTSSPRDTLRSFNQIIDRAYGRSAKALKSYSASGRLFFDNNESKTFNENLSDLLKASRCLELGTVSPFLKQRIAEDRTILLKEVFDRIPLPDFNTVPNAEQMREMGSKRWVVPKTEVEIILVEEGPRAGEYLFSADSVERLLVFYEKIKDLPYKPGPANLLFVSHTIISADQAQTIYEAYLNSPAGLTNVIPPRWMYRLPRWVTTRLAGATIWQWVLIAVGFAIGLIFVLVVHRLSRRFPAPSEEGFGLAWHRLLTPFAVVLAASIFIPGMHSLARVGGGTLVISTTILIVAAFAGGVWAALVAGKVIGEALVSSDRTSKSTIDRQLVRLSSRFIGFLVALALIVEGANQLGFPAYSVVTGLGVSGIAVALAARDSLANMFGSIVIMFEKPFSVGEAITIGDAQGTVEEVGFRSTRIRTFYNSVISIPNNDVVNATVDNMGRRIRRRQRFFISVRYDTPRDKLETFMAGIRDLIAAKPLVFQDNYHVRLNQFGESGLQILLNFFYEVPDYATEISERETMMLDIIDLARQTGVDFALPIRVLKMEQDANTSGILPSA